MSKAEIGMVAMAKGVSEFRKALIRVAEQIGKVWNRIPPSVRENLYFAALEQKSIDKYRAQARRDLGLPEEESA